MCIFVEQYSLIGITDIVHKLAHSEKKVDYWDSEKNSMINSTH